MIITSAIKTDTLKLPGNAAYGKTLINEAKHVDVSYVRGAGASKLVNEPRIQDEQNKDSLGLASANRFLCVSV